MSQAGAETTGISFTLQVKYGYGLYSYGLESYGLKPEMSSWHIVHAADSLAAPRPGAVGLGRRGARQRDAVRHLHGDPLQVRERGAMHALVLRRVPQRLAEEVGRAPFF